MSLAIPKSAILATLPGPFFVNRQFLAAMSLHNKYAKLHLSICCHSYLGY